MDVKAATLAYPRHVSEDADLVARALGMASRVFLFLDYGGTFVPEGRDSGRPSSDLTKCLSELCESASFSVFVTSSRSVEELRSIFDVRGLNLIGQGGLEIQRWDEATVYPVDPDLSGSLIHRLELESHRLFGEDPGIRIENRGFSVTLAGERLVSGRGNDASDRFARLVKLLDTGRTLELLYGRESVKARVAGWHKGDAVRHVLREADPEDSLAVYIGDDVTDEEGFEAVDDWSRETDVDGEWYAPGGDDEEEEDGVRGITVLVARSPRPTAASLFVRGPDEVYEFVSSLAAVAAALL